MLDWCKFFPKKEEQQALLPQNLNRVQVVQQACHNFLFLSHEIKKMYK
jgi:hypothetical protein